MRLAHLRFWLPRGKGKAMLGLAWVVGGGPGLAGVSLAWIAAGSAGTLTISTVTCCIVSRTSSRDSLEVMTCCEATFLKLLSGRGPRPPLAPELSLLLLQRYLGEVRVCKVRFGPAHLKSVMNGSKAKHLIPRQGKASHTPPLSCEQPTLTVSAS